MYSFIFLSVQCTQHSFYIAVNKLLHVRRYHNIKTHISFLQQLVEVVLQFLIQHCMGWGLTPRNYTLFIELLLCWSLYN